MDLNQTLAQHTPWGLTVAQTCGIGVVAIILFFGWILVRIGLQISGLIFRLGCAALMVFICGIVSFVVLYNLTNK